MTTEKMYNLIRECADSHAENGDSNGATAIRFAVNNTKVAALKRFPECKPAIINAYEYARQEMAA